MPFALGDKLPLSLHPFLDHALFSPLSPPILLIPIDRQGRVCGRLPTRTTTTRAPLQYPISVRPCIPFPAPDQYTMQRRRQGGSSHASLLVLLLVLVLLVECTTAFFFPLLSPSPSCSSRRRAVAPVAAAATPSRLHHTRLQAAAADAEGAEKEEAKPADKVAAAKEDKNKPTAKATAAELGQYDVNRIRVSKAIQSIHTTHPTTMATRHSASSPTPLLSCRTTPVVCDCRPH